MQTAVATTAGPLRQRAGALTPVFALVAIGLALAAVRSSSFGHRLPGFANVDEEIAVGVLQNLEQGPNPQFFHYGSLWFYVLRLLAILSGAQGPEALMIVGRAANWAMWLALAPAVYWLAVTIGASRYWSFMVGLVALVAPQAFVSASYINVDLAATVLTICAAVLGTRYIADPTGRNWLGFVVLAGLAVSTKYNAALLVVAFVIVVMTYLPDQPASGWPRTQLPRWGPAAIFGSIGLAATTFGLVGRPPLLHVLAGGSDNARAVIESDDIAAIDRVLAAAVWTGVLLALIAVACVLLTRVNFILRPTVIYVTPLTVVGVAVLGTPFSVLSPREFAYQAGAELALNGGPGDAQWANILGWTAANVTIPFLLGGIASLVLMRDRKVRYVAVLVILTAIVLGLSHRGFPRYALALLPGVLALTAVGLTRALQRWPRSSASGPITVLASATVLIFAAVQVSSAPGI